MPLQLVLGNKRTGSLYMVEVKPISDYFDMWRVTVRRDSIDVSNLEETVSETLAIDLGHVAAIGARKAILTEEVKLISNNLADIIRSVYQSKKRGLQPPEPQYETDENGNPSAFFTAHFTTCPVENLKAAKERSYGLRRTVVQRLHKIREFTVYYS